MQRLELGGVEGLQKSAAVGIEREIEDLADRLDCRSRHPSAALLEALGAASILDLQDRGVLLGLERLDYGAVGRVAVEQGADVIFAAAGNSGLGVFDAAQDTGKLAIGCDSNQNWVKPGRVLTSMVKRVDTAVYSIVKETVERKFSGGIHSYGLQNDGIAYALDSYNEKLIPKTILDEVETARTKIIKGEIKVTDAMAK